MSMELPRSTRNASEWNTWSDDASKCCVWLQQWPLSTREWWLRNFRSGGRLPQTQLTLHTLLLYLDCTIRHTRVRLYRTNIYTVLTATFMFACSNVVSHCSYYLFCFFLFRCILEPQICLLFAHELYAIYILLFYYSLGKGVLSLVLYFPVSNANTVNRMVIFFLFFTR